MTIDFITVGKTDSPAVAALVEEYARRISRKVRFAVVMLPDVKRTAKTPEQTIMKAEGEMLMKQFGPDDHVVLLDERGVLRGSVEFASWLERRLAGGDGWLSGAAGFRGSGAGGGSQGLRVGAGSHDGRTGGGRRLCFVVGGAYGFSREVYDRANEAISLSPMTFSHQIVRAIFAEQLYRALSIIAGEPYHHA